MGADGSRGAGSAWRENFGGFTADMETAEWDPPRHLKREVHSGSAATISKYMAALGRRLGTDVEARD
ncbi:MAG: hypothetical protein Q7J79_08460 [Gemmatimonadales bacterium]|nr:hypothetical protein [Gemmatimonadales bacterium]